VAAAGREVQTSNLTQSLLKAFESFASSRFWQPPQHVQIAQHHNQLQNGGRQACAAKADKQNRLTKQLSIKMSAGMMTYSICAQYQRGLCKGDPTIVQRQLPITTIAHKNNCP
jgi:hypothetical protein